MEQLETKEEIGGGIFFQYVNSIIGTLAGFIFYIYIIHFYTAQLVGTVALLLAITFVLNILFSFGIGYGLQHFVSYHLGRNEFASIRGIVVKFSTMGLGLALLSFVFLYITAPIFATSFFHSNEYVPLVRLLGIDLFFMVASTILSGILIGFQSFKSQALWNVIGIVVTNLVPVVLLDLYNRIIFVVLGWASGYAITSIAFAIFTIRRIDRLSITEEKVAIEPILKYAFPIFLASLVGIGASYVDRFVVSYFLNLSLLGVYNFALLISSAINFLVYPFATILLPKLSEMYGSGKKNEMKDYISRGIELISMIYVPAALLIAALSSDVLLFLASDEYLAASIPVTIVLFFSSIFITWNILSVSLQSIRKTKIFLLISSSALVSNFIISILLIPRFQMIGASIGYSSISGVSFFITYYYAKKFDILRFERVKMTKIYLSAFLMFLVVVTFERMLPYSPLKLLLFITVGFAIYSGMIKVLKTFDKSDLDFIMHLMPWWLQRLKVVISVLFL